jgi:hypothetical protein
MLAPWDEENASRRPLADDLEALNELVISSDHEKPFV